MTGPGAEMPFLEHLEELRVRLIRVLLALVVGFLVGYWLVQHFQAVNLLKAPIAPYLSVTGGKLVVTSPTEAVMITLKLALVVGLVLVSPYIIFQIWGFLSPALYDREKRLVVPALLAGTLMFTVGAAFGFMVLLPQSLPILFSFQSEGLENLITFSEYFSFVVQLCLAMGIAFEIPLLIMLLTALGVVSPATLNRFRRFAVVLAAVAGAVLSPGTDILSMTLMTVPILLLYEIGFIGSWLIHKRQTRKAAAAALLLLLVGLPGTLWSQQPPPKPARKPALPASPDSVRADSLRADSTRPRPGQALDTADARRLGLPSAPRRNFAPEDSVLRDLLDRPGFQATRFRSDSAVVFADERRIFLRGQASTKRELTTLEADSIVYQESECTIHATGDPALFDKETVLTGFGGIRYNTCIRRGVVTDALTSFKQGSTDWVLRGNLAQDSSAARLYASESEVTSCDLPVPHYHFSAREVKWISKTIMVARPAVLYVRDVPILWLPFVFQDGRPGRRSGILIPRFGLNDIVRQDPGYNRQITNVGYYWAPNDYFDISPKLDWFSDRYLEFGGAAQYRWLNRFVSGAIGYRRMVEAEGLRSNNIRWDHRQNFDLSTSLNLSLNYTSSGFVQQRNAIDPLQSTQQIVSGANFSKRYAWGTVSLGGNRRQNLSDNSVSMQLPSLSVSPKPFDIGRVVTWSPGLSVTNTFETNFPLNTVAILPGGVLDTLGSTRDTRTTVVGFETPLRVGGWNWRNSFGYSDTKTDGRTVIAGGSVKVPDPSTPDPTDSITVLQVATGDFASEINWETGINLPTVFHSTWKLQPSLGIANATPGPFMIRNRNTQGSWVVQGKRYSIGMAASPTFFGFFPGFGPIARIRHSFSPIVTWSYSPAASIGVDYARAVAQPGAPLKLQSDATQQLSVGLSQNFEGKARRAATDTSAVDNARRFRILGIQTGSILYDFEQAKLAGRTGWRTQSLSNQFQSDLLPGFNLSLTHDLWKGAAGVDTSKFDPFLQSVSASFAISGRTVRSVLGLFGLGGKRDTSVAHEAPPASYVASQSRYGRPPSFYGYNSDQTLGLSTPHGLSANFNYSLSRERPGAGGSGQSPRQSVGFSTSFGPTAFWTVSWSSQYNITDNKFESQVVRLERILHEWRAGFNFVRNPNGNFAFFVSVYLSDLPDLKLDYNQSSFEQ
jgi:Tat protein translocase TatC